MLGISLSFFAWFILNLKELLMENPDLTYCGIIIICGGLMFVDFVVYPYLRIYIPTNLHPHEQLTK